jgi:hypothetical protein
LFGTKTEPSGAIAGLLGPKPTFTRATTRSVRGFRRTTNRSTLEAIQIAPGPTATESGE